jgi:hypothetical protein
VETGGAVLSTVLKWVQNLDGGARVLSLAFAVAIAGAAGHGQSPDVRTHAAAGFLGFDKNLYPGDATLDSLRKTFAFAGYWLNAPPGTKTSTWLGKRKLLRAKGFGFLLLFNGKTHAQLKSRGSPGDGGKSDGDAAVTAAKAEGFPAGSVIFLDLEEGGRLLPKQRAYLHAWVDAVSRSGYRAGVYCSGIAGHEADGAEVVTALDIRENAGSRDITYYVANDQCPPSPGCTLSRNPPAVSANGTAFAQVWQFAQSPRRKQLTSRCARTYAKDGNCYAPGDILVDLNVALTPDPSRGR